MKKREDHRLNLVVFLFCQPPDHINTCMIYSPQNNRYSTAIESSVNDFTGYQIAISLVFPAGLCLYDRILIINFLLQKIFLRYRQINRRANISDFLIVLSDKIDRTGLCTVLVRHDDHLHDKTVQSRIMIITELVTAADIDAVVFKPYNLVGSDFSRCHMRNIAGSFSINILKGNQKLHLGDCAEF